MNAIEESNVDRDFYAFIGSGFAFEAKDSTGTWTIAEALERLRAATRLYIERYNENRSSVSAFRIIAKSLQDEGHIRPLPPEPIQSADDSDAPLELTREQYNSIPARIVSMRLKDPRFRTAVERLAAQGQI